jgi:outer membrane protein TolC
MKSSIAILLLVSTTAVAQTPQGPLTLRDAIRRGLAHNLGVIGPNNTLRQTQGQSRVARSGLLPNLSGQLREQVQQTNLAAFGFNIPNAPTVVGPFNYFDLRSTLQQTIADLSTLNNYRASKANVEAASQTLRDARDVVVLNVAGAYLQVLTTQSRIVSVQSQIETAKTIFNQLQQQREAGVVAPLEVTRSQVELQSQQQRLTALQNDLAKQKINLAHMIGITPDPNYELADRMPASPTPELSAEQAMQHARETRGDLKAAEARVRAAEHVRASARAERLPSLGLTADYGAIGKNPSNSHGTFTIIGSLRFPIWEGGRISGEIQQAEAALDQRKAEYDDLRRRIEADIRSAYLDMESARTQMEVARSNQELARETLRLSRERLDAGITTTVEVVQAQQSVSTADLDYISAVFAHNLAKLNLARAIGRTEENLERFLGEPATR